METVQHDTIQTAQPNSSETNTSIQSPSNQPTESDRFQRLENLLFQQAEETRRLQAQLSQQASAQPAPQAPQISYDDFISDPGAAINRALQHQVAPLQNQIATMTRKSNYDNMKSYVANLPQVAANWGIISGELDRNLLPILQTRDVTQQDFEQVVFGTLGRLHAAGQLQSPVGNTNPNTPVPRSNTNQNSNNGFVPPNPRSSVSPLPANHQPFQLPTLNEVEARIARTQNLSPLEYQYGVGRVTLEQARQIDPNFKAF